MSEGFQEMPGAKPLDERAATIPGHVERIMLRDYTPVNEGFHILYDAAELLRRYAARIRDLEAYVHSAARWSDPSRRQPNTVVTAEEFLGAIWFHPTTQAVAKKWDSAPDAALPPEQAQ